MKNRLDLLDYKILQRIYWDSKRRPMSVDDFEDLGVEKPTFLYHTRKLVKLQMVDEINTYPKFWIPIEEKRVLVMTLVKAGFHSLNREDDV